MTDTGRKILWSRLILGVSLALNLAVVGMVAGAFWRHRVDDEHGPGRRGGAFAAPYVLALPSDARHALRRTLEANVSRERRSLRSASYRPVLEALRDEPFDKDAVAEALQAQKQHSVSMQSLAQDSWLAQVAEMDLAARTAYVARIEELLARPRSKWYKDR